MKLKTILEAPNQMATFTPNMVLTDEQKQLLTSNCSDFIGSANRPIFRGMHRLQSRQYVEKVPIRQDRQPRNSSWVESSIFNLYVQKKTGIRYIRYRTSFATPDYTIAEHYGTPHFVFPINGSKILHFNHETDTLDLLSDINYNLTTALNKSTDVGWSVISRLIGQVDIQIEKNPKQITSVDALANLMEQVGAKQFPPVQVIKNILNNILKEIDIPVHQFNSKTISTEGHYAELSIIAPAVVVVYHPLLNPRVMAEESQINELYNNILNQL